MEKQNNNNEEIPVQNKVKKELSEAKDFAKSLKLEEIKEGGWFVALLAKVVQSYDRNARAEYLQQKYPGLPADEIADKRISLAVKYATLAGGITGAATSLNQVAVLGTAGATVAVMAGAIGVEMIYLAHIQMRLILDLSVIYDLQLDADDPEDVMMVFGYALGVTPLDMVGKGVMNAAGAGTKYAVKKYISKGTLKSVQAFGRRIGIKILQRTIIKYAVPVASAAVGSSYNFIATKSVGKIAKSHFKNRGKVTEELRTLLSKRNLYSISFPAAVMYMIEVDGKMNAKEKQMYKAMLARMRFEEHTLDEFQRLISSEHNIIAAVKEIEDIEIRSSLIRVLALIAIYDGDFSGEEEAFLVKLANTLDVVIDIDELKRQSEEYKVIVKKSIGQKTSEATLKATKGVKNVATVTGSTVSNVLKKVVKRKK